MKNKFLLIKNVYRNFEKNGRKIVVRVIVHSYSLTNPIY